MKYHIWFDLQLSDFVLSQTNLKANNEDTKNCRSSNSLHVCLQLSTSNHWVSIANAFFVCLCLFNLM